MAYGEKKYKWPQEIAGGVQLPSAEVSVADIDYS